MYSNFVWIKSKVFFLFKIQVSSIYLIIFRRKEWKSIDIFYQRKFRSLITSFFPSIERKSSKSFCAKRNLWNITENGVLFFISFDCVFIKSESGCCQHSSKAERDSFFFLLISFFDIFIRTTCLRALSKFCVPVEIRFSQINWTKFNSFLKEIFRTCSRIWKIRFRLIFFGRFFSYAIFGFDSLRIYVGCMCIAELRVCMRVAYTYICNMYSYV